MFKINDKLVLNAVGLTNYPHRVIAKRGCYATVVDQVISTKKAKIIRLRWFYSDGKRIPGWQNLNFYSKYFQLLKPKPKKPYNHPLTPIFAKKMPHFGPPKIKRKTKKRVDRKIFS